VGEEEGSVNASRCCGGVFVSDLGGRGRGEEGRREKRGGRRKGEKDEQQTE
jgi:hypothetical protein